jgi:hypothetical protein
MSHLYERLAGQHIDTNAFTHAVAIAVGAVGMLVERAQHRGRDAWLASAADIGELERRMRSSEGDE